MLPVVTVCVKMLKYNETEEIKMCGRNYVRFPFIMDATTYNKFTVISNRNGCKDSCEINAFISSYVENLLKEFNVLGV